MALCILVSRIRDNDGMEGVSRFIFLLYLWDLTLSWAGTMSGRLPQTQEADLQLAGPMILHPVKIVDTENLIHPLHLL